MLGLVLRPKIGVMTVDQKNPPWYTSIKFYVGIQKVKRIPAEHAMLLFILYKPLTLTLLGLGVCIPDTP